MNTAPSSAPPLFLIRRALVIAGSTLVLATSCESTPDYDDDDDNVFVQPRYGYGSPQATDNMGRPVKRSDERNYSNSSTRKVPDIKRDPNNTTVDVTPPESKVKKEDAPDTTDTENTASTPPETTETEKPADTATAPPAAPREDLQFGQPVVGKKGFVYSPFAPDKGQVDVEGIPAGTKVKCPYTGKVFRVP